jgi:GNAT superfamily N-acetyltransferase
MTYNPRYYLKLMEDVGCSKAKDLIAFRIDLAKTPLDRLGRIARRVRERLPELNFHPIRRKTLEQELSKVKEVYNEAWEDNWGFVPMTAREVDFLAERLRPLLMEGIVWLAEAGDDPVAFLLALPDYNVALKPLRGRLLTPKLLGFIPYLLQWKYPPRSRVIALGVKKRYRGKGLEMAMLFEGLKAGYDVGFTEAEASWILEDNRLMIRGLEVFGADPYKRYRLFEKPL